MASAQIVVNFFEQPDALASPQSICDGDITNVIITNPNTVTGTTFSWTIGTVTGTVSGQNSGNGNVITQTLASAAGGTVEYLIVPSANGCDGTILPVIVTVDPIPIGTAVPAGTYFACSGETLSIAPITNVPSSTFIWVGDNGSGGTGNLTDAPVNTTDNPINVTYTVTPAGPGSTFCIGADFDIVVTVNPNPSLTVVSAPTEVCSEDGFTFSVTSSTANNTLALVDVRYTGVVGGSYAAFPVTAPNSLLITEVATLSNTTNTTIGVEYDFQVTTSDGCPLAVPTTTVTVNVAPLPTMVVTNNVASLCSGSATDIDLTTTLTDVGNVTFVLDAVNNTAGVSGFSSPGLVSNPGDNIADVLVNSTDNPVTITYDWSVFYKACDDKVGAGTFTADVTVNPNPSLTVVSAPTEVCSQDGFTFSVTSSTANNTLALVDVRYTGVVGGSYAAFPVTAPNSLLITEVATLSNTTNTTIGVEYDFQVTTSDGCPLAVPTTTVTVNVAPLPTMVVTNNVASLCSGSATDIDLTTTLTDVGNVTFVLDAVNNTAGVSGFSSPGLVSNPGDNIADVLVNSTDNPVTITYDWSVFYKACDDKVGAGTFTADVTVNPNPSLTVVSAPTEVCSQDGLTFDVTSSTALNTIDLLSVNYNGVSGGSYTGPFPVSASNSLTITEIATLVNATDDPLDVTYEFQVTTADGCPLIPTSEFTVVTVYPKPTMSITNGTSSICSGETTSLTLNSTTNNTDPSNPVKIRLDAVINTTGVTGFTAAGINFDPGFVIGDVLVNSTDNSVTITYEFSVTYGSCDDLVGAFTTDVTVNPNPSLIVVSPPGSVCSDLGLSFDVTSTTAANTIDLLSVNYNGVIGGSYTGPFPVSAPNSLTITELATLANTTDNPLDITYEFQVTTPTCPLAPVSEFVVIKILPQPKLTITNNNTSICSGDITDIDIVTLTQNGIVTITNITKSDPSLSGNSLIGSTWLNGSKITDLLVNPTDNIHTIDYEFTVDANGCPGTVTTRTVTVNPTPSWTVVDNGVTEMCEGQTTDIDLNSPTQNAVITLTSVTPSMAGLGGWTTIGTTFNTFPVNIADPLTNSNTTAETVTYTFDIAANGCTDPISKQVTIIVNPGPIFSITNTLPSICSGDLTSILLSSPTAGAVITLINVIPGFITGYSPIGTTFLDGNVVSDPLLNSTISIETIEYVFEISAAGCTNVTSQSAFVDVKPIPTWTVTNNAATICEGLVTDIDLNSPTDNAVITLSNIITSDPGVSGFTSIGTTFIFNPPAGPINIADALTNSTNAPQTVQYTFNIQAVGCADPISKSTTVTVIPSPTFTINNNLPSICSSTATDIDLNTPIVGAVMELIAVTPTGGVTGFSGVGTLYLDGAKITDVLVNPTNVSQTVTYEFQVAASGCINSTTQTAVVTVKPDPVWTVDNTTAPTICEGQVTDIILDSPTAGAQITIASITISDPSITGNTAALTVISGPFPFTLADPLTHTSTFPETITYEFTIAAAGCTDPVSKFTIVTINPEPTFTITNPSPTDEICSGNLTNIILNTPIAGGLIEITGINAGSVTGTSLVGATFPDGGVIADLLINPTNNIIDVEYTFIAIAPGCPSSAPQMTIVTVNPDPSMTITNNLSSLCEGIPTNIDLTSPTENGVITLTSVTTSDPGLTGFTLAGTTYTIFSVNISDVLINSTQTPQTIIYSFNIDANGCSDPVSQQVVVTVNPVPTFTVNNVNVNICSDETALIQLGTLTQNGVISLINVTPSNAAVSGFSPSGSTFLDGGSITDKLTNPTDNPQTVDYEFQVSANGCTEPTTVTETVTVFPNPVLTVMNNDLEICVGESTDIELFSPTQDAIITLDAVTTSDASVIGFTTVGTTFAAPFAVPTITDALTNGTNDPQTISYEFSIDANGCIDPVTQVIMMTINPTPSFTVTDNSGGGTGIICSEEVADIDIASPTANAVITLVGITTSSANVIGFSSIGTPFLDGSTITDILVNTGSNVETVDYTFAVTANGCALPPTSNITLTITVNPIPDVLASQNIQTICDGDFTNILLSNPNVVAGTTFSWTVVEAGGVTGASNGSGSTIAQQLFNPTNVPATATYTVTPSANGCNGSPIDVIITVNPTSSLATSGDQTICSPGQTSISITNPNNVAGTTFSWTIISTTNGILGANDGAGNLIDNDLINPNDNISGTVTYRITPTANGCDGPTTDVVVTVNPPAVVDGGLDFEICEDGMAQLNGSFARAATSITWSGGSGTFSDVNDPLATYTPSAADITAGSVVLTISSNDPDGPGPCPIVTDDVTVAINLLTFVEILSPALNQYAQSDPEIVLLASPQTPPGVWVGKGVLSGFYVPVAVPVPDGESFVLDTLTYTYTDLKGCVNSDSKIIRIDKNPDIKFGTKPGQDYCENQGIIDLFADLNPNITTGVWNGPGIIDSERGLFDPNLPGVTTHVVTYTVTDPVTGGKSVAPVTIRVHPKPVVSFNIGNLCARDSIQFFDTSVVNKVFDEDTIIIWQWNFNNERVDTRQNPVTFFKDPGAKEITLSIKTLTNSIGCVADTTITAIFGKPPIIDFKWSNICFNDTTLFTDKTVLLPGSQDVISNYTWNFGDGNAVQGAPGSSITDGTHPNGSVTFGIYEEPKHQYVNAVKGDLFDVVLTVATSANCINSLQQRVEILPSKSLSISQGYFEDFEAGRGGWFVEADLEGTGVSESDTSWIWGVANGVNINTQATNNKIWWTGANLDPSTPYTYLDSERSVVNGPCFDFRGIERPMFAFDYQLSNEANKDGVVLEYILPEDTVWKIVGIPDNGINWYNSSDIVSNPGQNNLGDGWTDTTSIWRNARFTLPKEVIGKEKVRIRIYFASNADNEDSPLNGFGFDNVFVGEKNRTVLVENFTSLQDYTDYSIFRNKMLDIENNLLPFDFVYLNYHINTNVPDSLNEDNDGVPRVRSGKYGISEPIHSVLDGSNDIQFGFNGRYNEPSFSEQLVDSRSLVDAPFNIETIEIVNTTQNIVEVKWVISSNQVIDKPIRVYTVVVEEQVILQNGDIAFNVIKHMMPDATGLSWIQDWQFNPATGIGTTVDIASFLSANGMDGETSLIWDINEEFIDIYDPTQLAVMVFIQDQETNEIYQAGYRKINDNKEGQLPVAIEDVLTSELNNITIFPNPVLNDLHFIMDDNYILSRDDFYWKIIDQRGLTMMEGELFFRNGRITISTEAIPNGLYHLVMGVRGRPLIYRKIAVMHR